MGQPSTPPPQLLQHLHGNRPRQPCKASSAHEGLQRMASAPPALLRSFFAGHWLGFVAVLRSPLMLQLERRGGKLGLATSLRRRRHPG